MKTLIALFLFLLFVPSAYSQSVSVGDVVQYQCNCLGAEWVRGKVEVVSGSNVRVRYGNLDNQVVTLPVNSPKLKVGNAARNPLETTPMNPMQRAFSDEVAGKYLEEVNGFAHYYDPQYRQGNPGLPGSDRWKESMVKLAELDSICRTRYQGITDWISYGYARPGEVNYRYGVWCQIAANRVAVEQRARVAGATSAINLGYTGSNLDFGFNEPGNPLRMEVQDMIWNRDKWRASKIAWLKPLYAKYNVAVPSDATAAVERRADELWKIVEQGAPTRSYTQPPWRDASVEAFVKNKLAAKFRGVQVVKIGLEYKTWVKRASESLVASDDYFNYYKVSYNSYKRGTVLIKLPGRPFCQSQEFVIGQGSKGLIDAGIGGSGVFMRCE